MWRIVAGTVAQYRPDELQHLLPAIATLPARERHTALPSSFPSATEPPVRLSRAARAIWDGHDSRRKAEGKEDRSASLVRIARMFRGVHLPPEGIVVVLAERDQALRWHKFSDRRDATEQYRLIADLVQVPQT